MILQFITFNFSPPEELVTRLLTLIFHPRKLCNVVKLSQGRCVLQDIALISSRLPKVFLCEREQKILTVRLLLSTDRKASSVICIITVHCVTPVMQGVAHRHVTSLRFAIDTLYCRTTSNVACQQVRRRIFDLGSGERCVSQQVR